MSNIFHILSFAFMAGIAVSSASAATYQGTFTAATVDIFDNSTDSGTSFGTGPDGATVVVERGPSTSAAYGKARGELGSNGFLATSGAAGFSAWSDGFTLTGGSGAGELDISVSIHGAITGTEADMAYGLYVSSTPFSVDSETGLNDVNVAAALANATRVLWYVIDDANGSPNVTLTGKLNVTFGQTFYLLSHMSGDVCTRLEDESQAGCTGGSEDFYNSAVFGLTAPTSAAINTLSGHGYAAAVPEPESLALFVMGLITVSVASRRANRQSNGRASRSHA
ncbi:PEP-CTERM sorting domain-containing protein [Aquabacterium sp.]|uniref:PEP-CTERM sorting domain-containing protein n=1 Tax=Aquabacterium sp. TaxID=1872578 RepID=UPI001DE995C9|nr:PEP-CTERM sorting domain-containing protein [Aquabacterium sp.]MBT9611059.1 PEP-CTERM sorting domain-containing protein [Aquabacterium sp.]|tara:strand:+ start:496 stop:1338 length:843 start_codon:yes stop_codon:yes gene_type:complete